MSTMADVWQPHKWKKKERINWLLQEEMYYIFPTPSLQYQKTPIMTLLSPFFLLTNISIPCVVCSKSLFVNPNQIIVLFSL